MVPVPETLRRRPSRVLAVTTVAAAALIGWVGSSQHTSTGVAVDLRPAGGVTQLPLAGQTGDATQVVTVTAPVISAHSARLQAWERVPGGWVRIGASVTAHLATGGLTSTASELDPATPIGSFALTQAFGKLPNPGTTLPYFQVTPGDWWISEPGRLYNTHQLCTIDCPFRMGSPNTQLSQAVRAYNYGVVIDYNRNPVVQGAGSAYFLHVTTAGAPTRGCISVNQQDMQSLLRWLNPGAHPRILVGIA